MTSPDNQRLRIGVVSFFDLADKSAASGTPHRIAAALQAHCGQVVDLSPLTVPAAPIGKRVFWRVQRALTGKRPRWKSSRACVERMAAQLDSRLKTQPCDVVFSAFALWSGQTSPGDIPRLECTDSTVPLVRRLGWYRSVANFTERSLRETCEMESALLNGATACIASSTWCVEGMRQDYRLDPERLFVAPLGANLDADDVPERSQALSKPQGRCRLLFLGVEWQRKGGPVALETMDALARMGVDAELVVVGCHPDGLADRADVTVEGFVDKNDPQGRQRLHELLLSAHFLFVPTRAEAYGIMYCEGNAYGLPAIGTSVGGVTEIIRDGDNGIALPLGADGADYAERIAEIYRDRPGYDAMVQRARTAYETRLNWDAWGRTVADVMRRTLPPSLAGRVNAVEQS